MNHNDDYPINLLKDVRLNELHGSEVDYENLSLDQRDGINYLMALLEPMEMIMLREHYESRLSVIEISSRYKKHIIKVRKLIESALRKFQRPDWAAYIIEGLDQHRLNMEEKISTAETELTQVIMKAHPETHYLYHYGFVSQLSLLPHAQKQLRKNGILTIREAMLFVQNAGCYKRIKHLGKQSVEDLIDRLKFLHLLPEPFEQLHDWECLPEMEMRYQSIMNLKLQFLQEMGIDISA